MRKFLQYPYYLYMILVFLPVVAFFTTTMGLLTILAVHVVGQRKASLVGMAWARLLAWATPAHIQVLGRENVDPNQSYVICANHMSHYDILALYGWIGVDFKWVMKIELRKIPFLGSACEKLGHIYIDRSNRAAALASLEEAKTKIVNGTSVLFFPEGTRRNKDTLSPFKKGAFNMAVNLELPILPVSLVDTRHILPPRTLRLFPGRAKMVIGKPIETSGYTLETVPELMELTKDVIQKGVDDHLQKR